MKALFISILFLVLFIRKSNPTDVYLYANFAQKKCLSAIQSLSQYQDVLGAIICGDNHLSVKTNELFKKTQLIHLLVISGSHLLFIDLILSFLGVHLYARLILILIFTFVTGLNPPSLRACISLFFLSLLKSQKITFPQDISTALAGILTLIFDPELWNSRSLILSWSASLGLSFYFLFSDVSKKSKLFMTQFFIYIIMTPSIWGLGNHHPMGILINLVFAPLLGLFLLPFSLVVVFLKFLIPFYDLTINLIFKVLTLTSELISTSTVSRLIPISFLWIYLFALHGIIWIFRVYFLQRKLQIKFQKGSLK